ncbi:hypothetical protein [Erythrobacter sp. JK5]|uniref:hypothetical protein n=1 Tax=Erythrobacter sp. JK5 TaxID=2829500 RepID=UPI001BAA2907|nr:hypothetical protein [Erythrobacter sp. JK5]QUL38086.1 hypothetical protein KDC96_01265 [Erythrobacter sp. JK5]
MEDVLAIVFPGVIMMLIVIGLAVNGIVSKVIDYKKSQAAIDSNHASGQGREIAERTAMIEDRLAVLERIATDRGHLLADEIEALRHEAKSKEVAQ